MNNSNVIPLIDNKKLLDNAIFSIRLGVEDYSLATRDSGDPTRALSAIRNLMSGILLLFKYRISLSANTPYEAAALIYKTSKFNITKDKNGDIIWQPNFQDRTIESEDIKTRFNEMGIKVDWGLLLKIKKRRNDLEHLHPVNTLGELTATLAEIFPLINEFIVENLNHTPYELLGETWLIMMGISKSFEETHTECIKKWNDYLIPEKLTPYIKHMTCNYCSSSLITPSPDSISKKLNTSEHEEEFNYICLECNNSDLIIPNLIETLSNEHFYNPFNGEEPIIIECPECSHITFSREEWLCLWCNYEPYYSECAVCHTSLGLDEQDYFGLCSYHANLAGKV